MNFIFEKIRETLKQLEIYMCKKTISLDGFMHIECDYKKGNVMPLVDSDWAKFKKGDRWGGKRDSHCWFYKKIVTEENGDIKTLDLT